MNALVASGGFASAWSLAADVGWSADLASSLRQQNNVALSAASPIDTNSAELRVDLNLWHKTEIQASEIALVLKSDQYTQNAEFEQDVRSFSFEHSINTELNRYSIQAAVNRSTTLGDSYSSGEYIRRNVPVVNRSFGATTGHNINEAISVYVSANLSETRYSHADEISNQDYDDKQFSSSLRYQDSELADWQLSPYVDYMDQLQSGLQVATSGLALLRNYKISETWSVSGKYGRRRTQFDGKSPTGRSFSLANYGRVSSVDLRRRSQLGSSGISASKDISPRANGVLDETQRLSVWWQRALTERMNIYFNLSRVERKPVSGVFFSDDTSQSASLSESMVYRWSDRLSLDIQARLTKRENNYNGNRSVADGNMVSFGLRWQVHP